VLKRGSCGGNDGLGELPKDLDARQGALACQLKLRETHRSALN
jgi:hypothetical protein